MVAVEQPNTLKIGVSYKPYGVISNKPFGVITNYSSPTFPSLSYKPPQTQDMMSVDTQNDNMVDLGNFDMTSMSNAVPTPVPDTVFYSSFKTTSTPAPSVPFPGKSYSFNTDGRIVYTTTTTTTSTTTTTTPAAASNLPAASYDKPKPSYEKPQYGATATTTAKPKPGYTPRPNFLQRIVDGEYMLFNDPVANWIAMFTLFGVFFQLVATPFGSVTTAGRRKRTASELVPFLRQSDLLRKVVVGRSER